VDLLVAVLAVGKRFQAVHLEQNVVALPSEALPLEELPLVDADRPHLRLEDQFAVFPALVVVVVIVQEVHWVKH
jgi:hypothetical protein